MIAPYFQIICIHSSVVRIKCCSVKFKFGELTSNLKISYPNDKLRGKKDARTNGVFDDAYHFLKLNLFLNCLPF